MDTLTQLGLKFQTDKATFHHFTGFYDVMLNDIRNNVDSLLEIGVYAGASLRMWEEYFTQATIYGIDIDPRVLFSTDRIKTFLCSQTDFRKMDSLFKDGSIDIIVDDGSHIISHQINSFLYMKKFLKPKGIYILEDLHTSYMPAYIDSEVLTIDFLKNIDKERYNIDDILFFHYPNQLSITSIIKFK